MSIPHLIVDAPGGDPLSIRRLQARLEPCGDIIGNGPRASGISRCKCALCVRGRICIASRYFVRAAIRSIKARKCRRKRPCACDLDGATASGLRATKELSDANAIAGKGS